MRNVFFKIFLSILITGKLYGQPAKMQFEQGSGSCLIYKVTTLEYTTLLKRENLKDDSIFNRKPFAVFPITLNMNTVYDSLPAGLFVCVSLTKNDLKFQFISKSNRGAALQFYKGKPGIRIWNSEGQVLSDLTVKCRRRNLKFNPESGLYSLRNRKRCTITIADDSTLDKFILKPTETESYYGGGYGYYENSCPLSGFALTSQPIYRTGDTLRCKAYIHNCKGKSFSEKVRIRIGQGRNEKDFIDSLISPVAPGTFVFDYFLSDSLKIDDSYHISFSSADRLIYGLFTSCDFRIEDYKLEESFLSFEILNDEVYRHQPLYFRFKATDNNGLPLPDASVRITILIDKMIGLDTPLVITSDTIFVKSYQGSEYGELFGSVPESVFDIAARYNFIVFAEMRTASNEIVKKTFKGFYNNLSREFIAEAIQDSIFIKTDKDYHKKINFYWMVDNHIISSFQPNPSSGIKINPAADAAIIESENESIKVSINQVDDGVSISSTNFMDTIKVSLSNKYHLPISYRLLHNDKITTGILNDAGSWQLPSAKWEKSSLLIEYIWAGKMRVRISTFQLFEKMLSIISNIPEKINPSDNSEIEINVTDYLENPVPGVNLTVVSNNVRFDDKNVPKLKYYGYDAPPTKYPSYLQFINRPLPTIMTRVDNNWAGKFGVKNYIYYQCLFSGSERTELSIPLTADDSGQIAIYPVKGNAFIQPSAVYADYKPIWFYEISDEIYSIPLTRGYHHFRVRLKEFSIDFDSILIEPNCKKIIAFNIDSLPKARVNYFEKTSGNANVTNSFLCLKNESNSDSILIRNLRSNSVHILKQNGLQWVCPTGNGSEISITLCDPQRTVLKFYPETDYYYTIKNNLLIAKYLPFYKKNFNYPENPVWHIQPEDKCRSNRDVLSFIDNSREKFLSKIETYKPSPTAVYNGNLTIVHPPLNAFITVVTGLEKPENLFRYAGSVTRFQNLIPDSYVITYIMDDGIKLISDRVKVMAGMTTYVSSLYYDTVSINVIPKILDSLSGFNQGFPEFETGELIGTVTESNSDDPIPFASIQVYQNNVLIAQTIADFDGNFVFKSVPVGYYNLKVISVGYSAKVILNVNVKNWGNSFINIQLSKSIYLSEVIISEYKIPLLDAAARATSQTINDSPTRNVYSIVAQSAGVYSSDLSSELNGRGSRYDGTTHYVDGIKTITGGIPAQYGSPSNGIVNMGKHKGSSFINFNFEEELLKSSGIRTSFRDNAIWKPVLITDSSGKAKFNVIWPDDLTQWSTSILAIDEKLRTGQVRSFTKSFKPIQASLSHPRFMVEGDSLGFLGLIYNRTGTDYGLHVEYSQDSKIEFLADTAAGINVNYHLPIVATRNDSMEIGFYVKAKNGFEDGEKHTIPIIKRGLIEHKGSFGLFTSDTTISLNGIDEQFPVNFYSDKSLMQTIESDLIFLTGYVHQCNEQISSRLIGLLIRKLISKNEKDVRKYTREINKLIRLLSSNQNDDGGWGWWGNSKTDLEFTDIVLEALLFAQQSGFETKCLKKERYNIGHIFDQTKNQSDSLNVMKIAAKLNLEFSFSPVIVAIESRDSLNAYDRLSMLHVRQLLGNSIEKKEIFRNMKVTVYGHFFWENDSAGLFDNSTMLTSLAFACAKKAQCSEDTLLRILSFIFSKRMGSRFENTLLSSRISRLVYDSYLSHADNGMSSIEFESEQLVVNKFPYASERNMRNNSIVRIKTKSPVAFGWYQDFWNTTPEEKKNIFEIKSAFYQHGAAVTSLATGSPAELEITLNAKEKSSYMMLEIPIPSGCIYETKKLPLAHAVHTEFFKDRVVIYFDVLPAGNYAITIPLIVRYNGHCTVNPACIQSMYFKSISGNNSVGEVDLTPVE